MKIRRGNFFKNSIGIEKHDFWPSFTDVMSTVTLVLFFLMLLIYIQYIVTGKSLESARKSLDFLRIQLADTEEKLAGTEDELVTSNLEISKAKDLLALLEQDIEKTMAELEQGKLELRLSQERIAEQERIIANSNQELEKLRAKLQNIAVLRLEVLTRVKESIEEEMGSITKDGKPLVTIGENANLVLNESLLFEFGKADISFDGRVLLRQLASAFENVLDDPEMREFIDTIHIQGHTCNIGESASNMELSSKRAYNVVNYMMSINPSLEAKGYAKFFAASGYSEHRPVDPSPTEAARSLNRRIEISINIKDSNVQKIINEYLDNN